jgi:multiple sugar transport system permease protein
MTSRRAVRFIPLLFISALMLLPLFFLFSTSLKSINEIYSDNPPLFPQHPQWENYHDAFTTFPFFRYLANTLIITGGRVFGVILSCAIVAWGFARYKSRFNGLCSCCAFPP